MRIITVWEQERKPCPFCGGEAELFVDGEGKECGIACPHCDILVTPLFRGDTIADTYDILLDCWNRRVKS